MRDVFGAEIPHYFRDLYDEGDQSVSPRVELAGGLATADPRCVVSILGCTGDWTGGWDNTPPEGADRFITADLQRGRMVEVIERGEPALMVCHWTGIHWNGQELGFRIFQEVVRRLHARFDNLLWMKLSEVARYWAARELTKLERKETRIVLHAPFACPDFTLDVQTGAAPIRLLQLRIGAAVSELREVASPRRLVAGSYHRTGERVVACFPLGKGESQLEWS